MAKFVFVFRGGAPSTPEEGQKMMSDWGAWLEKLGSVVLDSGSAVGKSEFVGPSDSNPISGYMTIDAADMGAAKDIAGDCPAIDHGGSIEVAPAIEM